MVKGNLLRSLILAGALALTGCGGCESYEDKTKYYEDKIVIETRELYRKIRAARAKDEAVEKEERDEAMEEREKRKREIDFEKAIRNGVIGRTYDIMLDDKPTRVSYLHSSGKIYGISIQTGETKIEAKMLYIYGEKYIPNINVYQDEYNLSEQEIDRRAKKIVSSALEQMLIQDKKRQAEAINRALKDLPDLKPKVEAEEK